MESTTVSSSGPVQAWLPAQAAVLPRRYVTPGGFRESALAAGLDREKLDSMEGRVRARMMLYRPGGQMALELAKNPTVLIVNDSVFAHGGVLSQHGGLRPRTMRPACCMPCSQARLQRMQRP